jgi:hypothetical protein
MTFYNKYFKYKNKYLNLKKIIHKGGVFEKDGIKMVRIDGNTDYKVSELKKKLEDMGLKGAAAIKKYKGKPGDIDDVEDQMGKIGVKTFFEAGYTFQELKDGGFNINNFIDSKILNKETPKEAYSLDMNDIKNILSAENNFRKLIDIGFGLDNIAKVITEDSKIKYDLGSYPNPQQEFVEIYEELKLLHNDLSKLHKDLSKIFNIDTLKEKFNFVLTDFYKIKKTIKEMLEYFPLEELINKYYKYYKYHHDYGQRKFVWKEIEPELIDFLLTTLKLEDLFKVEKLRIEIQKKYTTQQLKLSWEQIINFLEKNYYDLKQLAKEFSIQELWDKIPSKRNYIKIYFKDETDKIEARITFKKEHLDEEPTDEDLESIIQAKTAQEKEKLKLKRASEEKRREEIKIGIIINQIKAYELKKLKDSGISIQTIVENPENNIEAILMVFTAKEITDAGLQQFYPKLNKLDLYNYVNSWFDKNWLRYSFYMNNAEYVQACSFMCNEALPRYLDLIDEKLTTDEIIKKWTRSQLIKRIDMSLKEEYMSILHPYWDILQRRMREMDYQTNVKEKWINTATKADMEKFLSENP